MRNLLYAATAITALALTPAANATTVMTVTLSEPLVSTFTSAPSTTGAISVGPMAFGTFPVNQVSGQDQSALAIPGILNSNSINISGSFAFGGTLTVDVRSTGLTGKNEALGTSSFAVNASERLDHLGHRDHEDQRCDAGQQTTFTGLGTDVENDLVDLGLAARSPLRTSSLSPPRLALGNANLTIDLSGTPVPEPASLALLGIGVLGVGFVANRKRSV